jgi:hypothetical protein
MPVHLVLLGGLRLQDRVEGIEMGGLEGGEKGGDDDLIHGGAMQRGTYAASDAAGQMFTVIPMGGLVTGPHTRPAHPADRQALE